jgi:transcriptional regulator with XRE-family HTH domain
MDPRTPSMYEVDMHISHFIGSNLRRLRGKESQEDFCARTGIDQSSLSLWENGKRLKHLQAFADKLEAAGIDPAELIRPDDVAGEGRPAPDDAALRLARTIRELPDPVSRPLMGLVEALSSRLTGQDADTAELLAMLGRVDPAARAGITAGVRQMVESLTGAARRPSSSPGIE